jgi:spermidine/putrescine transport system permease protein
VNPKLKKLFRERNYSNDRINEFLGWPALFWLLMFVLGPLIYLLVLSFLTKGTYGQIEWKLQTQNFTRSFEWIYVGILQRSLVLATLTTLSCWLLSVPMAWAMATAPAAKRSFWFSLLLVPFLMNLISRVYALRSLTSFEGPLARVVSLFSEDQSLLLSLSQNSSLVMYGMVATYLPFMLFPIFVALEKFDYTQFEAAQDLGAGAWSAFFRVVLPQLRPAISSGLTMVFVPALGEFVIPDLLGGAKMMLAGGMITEQFLKSRDWPFGAALATEMILFMSVLTLFLAWWGRNEDEKS